MFNPFEFLSHVLSYAGGGVVLFFLAWGLWVNRPRKAPRRYYPEH